MEMPWLLQLQAKKTIEIPLEIKCLLGNRASKLRFTNGFQDIHDSSIDPITSRMVYIRNFT